MQRSSDRGVAAVGVERPRHAGEYAAWAQPCCGSRTSTSPAATSVSRCADARTASGVANRPRQALRGRVIGRLTCAFIGLRLGGPFCWRVEPPGGGSAAAATQVCGPIRRRGDLTIVRRGAAFRAIRV